MFRSGRGVGSDEERDAIMSVKNADDKEPVSPEVLADRALTHAVECAWASNDNADGLARAIENACSILSRRAKAAQMVPLSTSIFAVGSPAAGGSGGVVTVGVMLNWIFKDNLEALQRQQALMGGNNRR